MVAKPILAYVVAPAGQTKRLSALAWSSALSHTPAETVALAITEEVLAGRFPKENLMETSSGSVTPPASRHLWISSSKACADSNCFSLSK